METPEYQTREENRYEEGNEPAAIQKKREIQTGAAELATAAEPIEREHGEERKQEESEPPYGEKSLHGWLRVLARDPSISTAKCLHEPLGLFL